MMDYKIKSVSQVFYGFVGNKNLYIRWLRKGNKATFTFIGVLRNIYKSIH